MLWNPCLWVGRQHAHKTLGRFKVRLRSICNSFRKNPLLPCIPDLSTYNMLPFNISMSFYLISFKSVFKHHSMKKICWTTLSKQEFSLPFPSSPSLYLFYPALIFFPIPSILYLYVLICLVSLLWKKVAWIRAWNVSV